MLYYGVFTRSESTITILPLKFIESPVGTGFSSNVAVLFVHCCFHGVWGLCGVYRPSGSRRSFHVFPTRSLYKTCGPLYKAIYGPGHNLNILGKGPLNVATSTFFSLCDPDMQRTETI